MTDLPLPRRFAEHLGRDRRRSVHTIRAYEATAIRLLTFLQGHWGGPVTQDGLAGLAPPICAPISHTAVEEGLSNTSAARELIGQIAPS